MRLRIPFGNTSEVFLSVSFGYSQTPLFPNQAVYDTFTRQPTNSTKTRRKTVCFIKLHGGASDPGIKVAEAEVVAPRKGPDSKFLARRAALTKALRNVTQDNVAKYPGLIAHGLIEHDNGQVRTPTTSFIYSVRQGLWKAYLAAIRLPGTERKRLRETRRAVADFCDWLDESFDYENEQTIFGEQGNNLRKIIQRRIRDGRPVKNTARMHQVLEARGDQGYGITR